MLRRLIAWLRARHAVAALARNTATRPLTIRDVHLARGPSAAPRKFNF